MPSETRGAKLPLMQDDEAVSLLPQLLQHDTSNPPGNERPAQELVVGRLRGRPVLGLLSHVDTVGADPRGWHHDPWPG
jgi:acetylornithine deacetylase/succinyl-diaminopimelate desuccinylase-like protein